MERICTRCKERKSFLRPLLEFQVDYPCFSHPGALTCQNASINCSNEIKEVLSLQKGTFVLKYCLLGHGMLERLFEKVVKYFSF